MIEVKSFYDELINNNIDFFAGVPDSLLKNICAYISSETASEKNVITANEGAAIALGAGYHIATGKIPLIYLQNSGLGNTVNPILSLVDKEVYAIPMLLMVGWRGEPGITDEPQHFVQGKLTLSLLESMDIPYQIVNADSDYKSIIKQLSEKAIEISSPVAMVISKNCFSNFTLDTVPANNSLLSREEALETVINAIPPNSVIVSTTGMLSRELFELREKQSQSHEKDFLTVGSMGHTLPIALGIALAKPDINVYCLDGDGSAIMHLGSYAIAGSICPNNLRVIIFNNGAHDSVGGQPTVANDIDFNMFAQSVRLNEIAIALTHETIREGIEKMEGIAGTSLMEIKIKKGARKDLGRPTSSPIDNKKDLMTFINNL